MKLFIYSIVVASLLISCRSDTEVHGKYFGRGVCSVYIRDTKEVAVNEVRFHNETSWEWCWSFPPWCTVIIGEYYDYGRTFIDIPHEHLRLKCCPGYKSNAEATACIPVCSPLCKKGYCIDVDKCSSCVIGYTGPKCDKNVVLSSRDLPESVPSPNLLIDCNCTDDNYVCAENGTCVCAPGFRGMHCETIIDPNAFIVDPGEGPVCLPYILRVICFLALIVLASVGIFWYIKRRFNIVEFRPLINRSTPSTSTSTERIRPSCSTYN